MPSNNLSVFEPELKLETTLILCLSHNSHMCSAPLTTRGWWNEDPKPRVGGGGVSGNTHFLLPLHYLLSHLPILFLKDINNHLWTSPHISKHYVKFPFTLCYSFLCLFLLFWYLCQTDSELTQTLPKTLCLFSFSPMFIFLSSFSYVTMSHLYFWGLDFPFTYSLDCPLAGLYPFLLGSPAGCANYCNYLCQ